MKDNKIKEDGKEFITNVITTIMCVIIALLIVLIGIGAGPWLFGKAGYSIDKEISSFEAASLTIQVLVAVVVIQLTSALKKTEKKSKKIKNKSLFVRFNSNFQKFLWFFTLLLF